MKDADRASAEVERARREVVEAERDELLALLRDARGSLRATLLLVDSALAGSADDAVGSESVNGCVHPLESRVPVAAMGGGSAFICKACGVEVEG